MQSCTISPVAMDIFHESVDEERAAASYKNDFVVTATVSVTIGTCMCSRLLAHIRQSSASQVEPEGSVGRASVTLQQAS